MANVVGRGCESDFAHSVCLEHVYKNPNVHRCRLYEIAGVVFFLLISRSATTE